MKILPTTKSKQPGRILVLVLFFLFSAAFLVTCGVILDEVKLKDTWKLQRVEYYEYLPAFGTYKVYSIESGDENAEGVPFFGAYFDNTDDGASLSEYYTLKLQAEDFFIQRIYTDPGTDTVQTDTEVDQANTSWSIDTVSNTITLNVSQQIEATDDVWQKGLTLVNDWPLADNDTLEIHVKASHAGLDYIRVLAKDGDGYKRIAIDSMKGIWVRYNE